MKRLALIILLIASSVVSGQGVVLPSTVAGEPSEFIQIKAETQDKVVKWKVLDPGLSLFPIELLKDTKTAVVVARNPGRYRLICVTAKGDVPSEYAMTVVVVGEAPPVDPPPVPVPVKKVVSLTFVVLAPTQKTADVTENAAFRALLKANGVGVYGITTQEKLDANPKFAGVVPPAIVLQDQGANVIASSPITDLAAANAFISKYLGK